MLKHHYANPLRRFARSKDMVIIPAYEAKTLFGNINNLLPVNEAFLTDLERMAAPNGHKIVGGVGDVALRHFKELCGFEQYKQYYVKREDAQAMFEREVLRKSSGFADNIYVSRHSLSLSLSHQTLSLYSILNTNQTSQVTGWGYVNFSWSLFNESRDTPSLPYI